jgi:signal transduction histidine kinase
MGLLKAIEYELESIQKTVALKIDLFVQGETFRLEPHTELIVFRIVQEALHNILKHAQATLVQLNLTYEPNCLRLTIRDNGVGLKAVVDNDKDYNSMGLGIRNMNNRAAVINAAFSLKNNPEGGASLMLALPIENN